MSMNKQHESALFILKTLNKENFEAYFVGGFVRDYLLKRKTNDIDITTNATPTEIEALFDKTVLTGKTFGTITVLIEGKPFEITTYRKETTYDNHRHPDSITFAKTLEEDLSRRDFTINQLVMDSEGIIHDYHNGKQDLMDKVIRTIGQPALRFQEDALRMLRAFRFSAQLNFSIERETLKAIEHNQQLITKISVERVQDELFKLLDAPASQFALQTIVETGVHKTLNLQEGFEKLSKITGQYDHLLAFALMDAVKGIKDTHFKFSNRFYREFKTLSDLHKQTFKKGFETINVFDYGKTLCLKANKLNILLGDIDRSDQINHLHKSLILRKEKDLAITGKDLLNTFDISDKRNISKTLRQLLIDVLNGNTNNQKQALLHRAENILKALKDSE